MPDRQRHGRLSDGSGWLFSGGAEPREAWAEDPADLAADPADPVEDGREPGGASAGAEDGGPVWPGAAGWFGSAGDERSRAVPSQERVASDAASDEPVSAGGPVWPGDPRAETMEISRAAVLRRLAAAAGSGSGSGSESGLSSESGSSAVSGSAPEQDAEPDEAVEPDRLISRPADPAKPAEPAETTPVEPAEPTLPAWQLAALQNRGLDGPKAPDPVADTMQLSRLTMPMSPPMSPPQPAPSDLEPEAGPDTEPGVADDEPIRSRSAVGVLQQRRRLAVIVAGLVAVAALLALPPVRAQLRDSFTRLPQPYTALYFTSPPQVDGTVLTVPVSVHAVDTGARSYTVHVWTVDTKGKIDDSRNVDLAWDGQAMSTTVSMPVNPAAESVWVSLNGSDQVLHYKIAVA